MKRCLFQIFAWYRQSHSWKVPQSYFMKSYLSLCIYQRRYHQSKPQQYFSCQQPFEKCRENIQDVSIIGISNIQVVIRRRVRRPHSQRVALSQWLSWIDQPELRLFLLRSHLMAASPLHLLNSCGVGRTIWRS